MACMNPWRRNPTLASGTVAQFALDNSIVALEVAVNLVAFFVFAFHNICQIVDACVSLLCLIKTAVAETWKYFLEINAAIFLTPNFP